MPDTDNTTAAAERPEFDRLVFELRALVRDQRIAKARDTGAEVMQWAKMLFRAGKLSAGDLCRLHAVRLRLDAELTEGDRT